MVLKKTHCASKYSKEVPNDFVQDLLMSPKGILPATKMRIQDCLSNNHIDRKKKSGNYANENWGTKIDTCRQSFP